MMSTWTLGRVVSCASVRRTEDGTAASMGLATIGASVPSTSSARSRFLYGGGTSPGGEEDGKIADSTDVGASDACGRGFSIVSSVYKMAKFNFRVKCHRPRRQHY